MTSNFKDIIKYICDILWVELIYFASTVIYLIFLNNYNHLLLSKFSATDWINILNYNLLESSLYLVFAIIFCICGATLFIKDFRKIKNTDLDSEDLIIYLIAMFFIIIFIILTIAFINNPILRAFLAAGIVGYAIANA